MCLPNFLQIALCVLQFSHFVGNRAVLQTLVGNHSQSGRTMHTLKHPLCFMAIEILGPNLCEYWTKSVGLLSKNVFWTHPHAGGAVTDPHNKSRVEFHLLHLGSVCAPFCCQRANGAWDLYSCRWKQESGCYSTTMRPIRFFESGATPLA